MKQTEFFRIVGTFALTSNIELLSDMHLRLKTKYLI